MSGNTIEFEGCELDARGDVSNKGVLGSLMLMQSKDLIIFSAYFFGMAGVFSLCFLITIVHSIRFAESGEVGLLIIFVCVTSVALAIGLFMLGLRAYSLGLAGLRHLARTV